MKSLFSTILLIILLLNSQCVLSQFSIFGTVVDDLTSHPIITVQVSAETNEGQIYTTYTNHDGRFKLEIVDTKSYTLQFSKEGYQDSKEENLRETRTTNSEIAVRLKRKKISSNALGPVLDMYDMPLGAVSSPERLSGLSDFEKTTIATPTLIYNQLPTPEGGQVTVGEWNDLHNWQDWITLLSNPDYSIMTELHQLYPIQRYAVLITNQNHSVLPNKKVTLLSQGIEVWAAMTDNAGRAELWSGITNGQVQANLTLKVDNEHYEAIPVSQGTNTIVLDIHCVSSSMMDIVFVVDATSSMSDEIEYLKIEILDVIRQIRSRNTDFSYAMGSVFYRDYGDDYLTRVQPLSDDALLLSTFIKNQNAAGGGDIPEALDVALEQVLNMNWREQSLKIAFLLLDAPPQDDQNTMNKIRNQIMQAASQGIKLIPITASGIDRQTEFLMKFISVLTNGTYIFITDDSGIGKSHLTPVVNDYEVEYLNECLVRLTSEYSRSYSCENARISKNEIDIRVFPNPTTDYITVATGLLADKIEVRTSNGMVVMNIEPKELETRIDLQSLINGVYHIMATFGEILVSEQIILLQ